MISLNCTYCQGVFLTASPPPWQDQELFLAAWKADVAANDDVYHCVDCGTEYTIVDDGVDVGSGGSVALNNVSKPRIDSLTITSGARTGGEALYIIGLALELDGLVARFDGKWALELTNQTATQARVVTPPGAYRLNVSEVIGPILIEGEEVVGQDSAAKGVLRKLEDYVVDNPTRAFSPNELVKGTSSGGSVRLQATPYSGAVDVEIWNLNGQRLVGGTLKNGFTYL